jgi:ubiquinone/menaquinone biosynthesis C-methylase UbiE
MNVALGKPADSGEFILERRFRLVKEFSEILKNKSGAILDVGCGNGVMTRLFVPYFERVVGTDVQEEPMLSSDVKAEWVVSGGEKMPFEDAEFDAITSFEVLEHVEDPEQMMKECYRVLKPGGQMILSVPNKWWIFETHGANLPLLPWNRMPFFSWIPKPLHSRWAKARIYTRADLANLIESGGFKEYKLRYITAPMDRAKPKWVQELLRKLVFGKESTNNPFVSVSHIAILTK